MSSGKVTNSDQSFCPILPNLEFRYGLRESPISNFTKILPVGVELIHADKQTDGRTDMTKVTGAFFASYGNAPKAVH